MTNPAVSANRGSVSTGYNIDYSANLYGNEGYYKTPSSAGNQRTFTVSWWMKRTKLHTPQRIWEAWDGSVGTSCLFTEDTDLFILDLNAGSNYFTSSQAFRDTAAWSHFVVAVDTTQSDANSRVAIFHNGVALHNPDTSANWTGGQIGQNTQLTWNEDKLHRIGYFHNDDAFVGAYYADFTSIDGLKLDATSFGEFDEDSGIWIPKDVSGLTYGTNGCLLEWKNNGSMGAVTKGNQNWSVENQNQNDQAYDTPTNNFCTINPVSYNSAISYLKGNVKVSKNQDNYGMVHGTHFVGGGKWYWECKATDFGTYSGCMFGIIDARKPTIDANSRGYEDPSLAVTNPEILIMSGSPNNWVMNSTGTITNSGAMSSVDYTFNEGDILAMALDMDNGAFWFGNSRYSGVANGSFWVAPGGTTTSGDVAITDPTNGHYALVGDGGGTNEETPDFNGGAITGGSLLTAGFELVTPIFGAYHSTTETTLEPNFGGYATYGNIDDRSYADANGHGSFTYAVPSGFYALCSKNIGEYGG